MNTDAFRSVREAKILLTGVRWRIMKANVTRYLLSISPSEQDSRANYLKQIRVGARSKNALISPRPSRQTVINYLVKIALQELNRANDILAKLSIDSFDTAHRTEFITLNKESSDLYLLCDRFQQDEHKASEFALEVLKDTIKSFSSTFDACNYLYREALLMPIKCYELFTGRLLLASTKTNQNIENDLNYLGMGSPDDHLQLAFEISDTARKLISASRHERNVQDHFNTMYAVLPLYIQAIRLLDSASETFQKNGELTSANEAKKERYMAEECRVILINFFELYGATQWRFLLGEILWKQDPERLMGDGGERYLEFAYESRPDIGSYCYEALREVLVSSGFFRKEGFYERLYRTRKENLIDVIGSFFEALNNCFHGDDPILQSSLFRHSAELSSHDLELEYELLFKTDDDNAVLCHTCYWFKIKACEEAVEEKGPRVVSCKDYVGDS